MRATEPINVGMIGCGARSAGHASAAAAGGACRVVYACDIIPERAATAASEWHAKPLDDYRELLADDGLDAVIIATDVRSHVGIARDAIAAGKHAIVEKPLGSDVPAARELARMGEGTGLVVYVCYQRRFCARQLELKAVAERIDPVQIIAVNQRGMMRPHFLNADPFCGVMDVVSHDIDQVLWFMGRPPLAVTATARRNTFTRGTGAMDALSALLDFGDGRSAVISSSIGAEEVGTRFDVIGACGNLRSGGGGVAFERFGLRFGSSEGRAPVDIAAAASPFGDMDMALQRAFVEEIRTGRKSQAARLQDGLASQLVMAACVASSEQGRRIELGELR